MLKVEISRYKSRSRVTKSRSHVISEISRYKLRSRVTKSRSRVISRDLAL